MSITMVIEFKGKKGKGDEIVKWFHKNYGRMTAGDGLIQQRLYQNSKNPDTILSIEEWVSEKVQEVLVQKSIDEGWWSEIYPSLLTEAIPADGVYHHFISKHRF